MALHNMVRLLQVTQFYLIEFLSEIQDVHERGRIQDSNSLMGISRVDIAMKCN
jgi:hypothetical protein